MIFYRGRRGLDKWQHRAGRVEYGQDAGAAMVELFMENGSAGSGGQNL
jgi:hypothetical protein